jgi:hypothetical protein
MEMELEDYVEQCINDFQKEKDEVTKPFEFL